MENEEGWYTLVPIVDIEGDIARGVTELGIRLQLPVFLHGIVGEEIPVEAASWRTVMTSRCESCRHSLFRELVTGAVRVKGCYLIGIAQAQRRIFFFLGLHWKGS